MWQNRSCTSYMFVAICKISLTCIAQGGANKVEAGTKKAMALSGNTLPQVSQGGSVSGTLHIVTSDGAGPYKALLDTTGKGDFSKAVEMDVETQVPGKNGDIKKSKTRAVLEKLGIYKRATNIDEDFVSEHYTFCEAETYTVLAIQGSHACWRNLYRYCCWSKRCLHGEACQSFRSRSK